MLKTAESYLISNRIYGLDIIRAFAILFVIIGHGNSLIKPLIPYKLSYLIVFDGVLIFFVLSGFLIGGILIKLIEKKGMTPNVLMSFWLRRWFRTLPNYYLVLVTIILISGVNPFEFKRYFLFIQNFASPHPSFFLEAWSLSVEEWFYLSMPLTLLLLIMVVRLKNQTAIFFIAFSICLISILLRYWLFRTHEINTWFEWGKIFRTQVITRLDSLMYGVLGAYFSYYYEKEWLSKKKILFVVGLIILIFHKVSIDLIDSDLYGNVPQLYHCVFSFSLGSIGVLLLLPLLSDLKTGGGRLYLFFTFISLISYSMYLVHHTIIIGFAIPSLLKFLPVIPNYMIIFISYLFYWTTTIGIAFLLYKYIELPVMKLRDKYFRS